MICRVKLKVSEREHKQRVEKVRERMEEYGLDLLLLLSKPRIFYLTGFPYIEGSRVFVLGIPKEGELFLIVPKLEEDHVKLFRRHWVRDIIVYWEYPHGEEPAHKVIRRAIDERRLSSGVIGVDQMALTPIPNLDDITLDKVLPDARLVHAKKIVDSMRLIKSREEVELLREAAKWANLAHTYLQEVIEPGISEMEASSLATHLATREMLKTLGPEYEPFDLYWYSCWARFKAGSRTSLPHGLLANRRVRRGDVIETAAEGRIGGYGNHLERTMFVGEPNQEFVKYFELMLKAREAALEAVKPDIKAEDVHRAVVRRIREEGYNPEMLLKHRSGHGLGLEHFEPPFLVEGDSTILRPGMVFTVEPGIYLPGKACFRHCDTVVVTEEGYEILDYYPTDLETLTIEA